MFRLVPVVTRRFSLLLNEFGTIPGFAVERRMRRIASNQDANQSD
jgi:hypothetical protein